MADLVSGYNIVEKLGIGARSLIYHVINPNTGEIFALKRVIREENEDTRFLEQAITEFEVSSKFSHPTLRKSIECKRFRKWMKLAEVQVIMEYVNGVSLEKRRPERIDDAVNLFIKLAEGLDAMHQVGYVHADIKPNNILITAEGDPKIIDFGQSCPVGFRKPRIQGTPDYIAPEQVKRQHLTAQTDVYNLGATLYWALTGQTFPTLISRKGKADEYNVATGAATPSPQQINPEVPTVLSRLVMESCAYRRSDRPKDMKDVIKRLEMAHHVLAKRRQAGHELATAPAGARPAPPTPAMPPVAATPPVQPTPEADDGDDDAYDFSALLEIERQAPRPGSDPS